MQIGFQKQARTKDHMFVLRTLIQKYIKHLANHDFYLFQ